MKISLCVITKNEENNINKCLECVSDILFEKIVVDTGSNDKTIEIAKKLGAMVFNFEWVDDFAAARNFAISKAKGDWIIFLDADEHIESSQMELLKDLIFRADRENKECIISKLINYIPNSSKKEMQSITTTVRVFKNHKNLRYFGAIHEMLRSTKNRQMRYLDASEKLIVYHSGYTNEEIARKDKSNRNLTLLFNQLEKDPDNILTLFYIGESLMIDHKFEEAIHYSDRAKKLLVKFNSNHALLYKLYCNLLICAVRPQFDFELFEALYNEATAFDEHCPDFYFYMGKKLYIQGKHKQATDFYEKCIAEISDYQYSFESKVLSRLNNIYEELLNLYIMLGNNRRIVETSVILLKADKYYYKSLLILVKTLKDSEKSAEIYNFLFKIYSKDNIKDKLYILRVAESLEYSELYDQVMALLSEQEKTEYLQYKEQDEDSQEEYKLEAQNLTEIECIKRAEFYKNKNNLNKSLFFQKIAIEKNPQLALDIPPVNNSNHNDNYYVEEDTEKIKENVINLISQGLYDEALELINQALQLITEDSNFFSIKAVVLIKQEKYEEAIETLNKALIINPEHVDSLYNLAFIYEQKNQMNFAVDLYKKIYNLSNEKDLLDDIKRKIINWQETSRQKEIKKRLKNNIYAKKQELVLKKDKSDYKSHIVYVLTHVRICGGVKIILEQANRLTRLGMKVSLVCHYPMPTWYPIEANYIEVPFDEDLSTGIPSCDVIVATYWDHIQACIETNIAPVTYFEQGDFHLFDYKNMDENLKKFVYQQYQLPRFIFTVTNQAADLIKKVFDRESAVIHNAIDTTVFNKIGNSKNLEQPPYILMMGNANVKFKGIDQIIEAYKKIKSIKPDIQLYWITPTNPPVEYVELADKCFVNPPQQEIAKLYRGALVYVSASHYESFSLPVLEAMACGCPVVTTGNNGVLEYAKDNYNVVITKIGDYHDIAKKTMIVFKNEDLRNKLITNGLLTAQKFNWDHITSKLMNFYKDVARYEVSKLEHSIEKKPKLSVILPVFNSEKYLQSTIQSILKQTFSDFELIIINDGSIDSSENIIKSFIDPRIKYIYQDNAGVAAARNKGLDLAKGDFITFHDSDDISIDSRFETLLTKFNDYRNIGAVHSDMLLINEIDSPIGYWQSTNLRKDNVLKYFVKQGTPFNNGSFIYKKEAIGTRRYDTHFKIGEDTKFVLEVVKNIETSHIPEPLLLYRRHSGNKTKINDYNVVFSHVNSIIQEISLNELFPELEWEKHNYQYNLVRAKVIVSLYLFRRGMKLEAQNWFNEALTLISNIDDKNLSDFVLGIGNLINKNYDESIKILSSCTHKDHIVENYLAEAYGYKNDTDRSMKLLLKAVKSYPNYIDAQENMKSLGGLKHYNIIDNTSRKFKSISDHENQKNEEGVKVNGIYIGNNKILVQTKIGFRMLIHADDLSLTPVLVFDGIFEYPLTKYLMSAVKKGNTVFDLGANIGYFTLLSGLLTGPQGKVVAYEANTKNYNILKENVAYNILGDRVQLYNRAIYSEKTELNFYSSNKWTGNGSLTPHSEDYFNRFSTDEVTEEKVMGEPLDIHFDKFSFIDFVKMDIEGGEYNGFLGMKKLLEYKKVGEIIFEINYLRMKDTWDDCKRLLKKYQNDYNLSFYIIDKDGKLINTNLNDLFNQEFVESVVIKCNN